MSIKKHCAAHALYALYSEMNTNIPNLLTLARIVLIPVLAILVYKPEFAIAALALYIVCALTDFLDGYLARKMNAISAFGTFLDPIADKIFVAVLLLVLVDVGALSGFWIVPVIIIVVREFLVSGMREFLGPKNVTLPVTQLAKWKTTIQMLALGILIAAPALPALLFPGQLLLTVAAVLTFITGWSYLKEGAKHMGS